MAIDNLQVVALLLKQQRYEDAYVVLQGMDTPKAREWMKQIEQRALLQNILNQNFAHPNISQDPPALTVSMSVNHPDSLDFLRDVLSPDEFEKARTKPIVHIIEDETRPRRFAIPMPTTPRLSDKTNPKPLAKPIIIETSAKPQLRWYFLAGAGVILAGVLVSVLMLALSALETCRIDDAPEICSRFMLTGIIITVALLLGGLVMIGGRFISHYRMLKAQNTQLQEELTILKVDAELSNLSS
jgi:hypothetical protein